MFSLEYKFLKIYGQILKKIGKGLKILQLPVPVLLCIINMKTQI